MKRFFAMVMMVCLLGNTVYGAEITESIQARPVKQMIEIDHYDVEMQGYNINGYNYMRLRDVAKALTEKVRGDDAHFDIVYDAENNSVALQKGKDYKETEEGKHFAIGTEDKVAVPSQVAVYIDEELLEAELESYIIDGYTYYKLRDLGKAIGFCVDWLEATRTVQITTRQYAVRKPVIYLYPEETTDVSVNLEFKGDLTVTYPAYNNGWNVTAQPDGTLLNHADGKEYPYLFWEGKHGMEMNFSEGFVVKGEDTAVFLQDTLSKMGLTPREYHDFIVYWLPEMQENPYNLISFQWENYEEAAKLDITPAPDNMLRVFMAFQALEAPVEVAEQSLPVLERSGFTVVEWGGTEVK